MYNAEHTHKCWSNSRQLKAQRVPLLQQRLYEVTRARRSRDRSTTSVGVEDSKQKQILVSRWFLNSMDYQSGRWCKKRRPQKAANIKARIIREGRPISHVTSKPLLELLNKVKPSSGRDQLEAAIISRDHLRSYRATSFWFASSDYVQRISALGGQ